MQGVIRTLCGGMAATALAIGLGRFAYTPLLPVMQADFGFDSTIGAWLATANNIGYLAGAVACGWVSGDALRHRMLLLNICLLVVSLALMPVTESVALWWILRLTGGICSAFVFVLASSLIVPLLMGGGYGRWSGFHFGGVGLGIILSGSLVGLAGSSWGSQTGWEVAAAIGAWLGMFAWPVLRDAHPVGSVSSGSLPTPLNFSFPMLAASYFCEGLGYIVTGTFLVAMVKTTPGLTEYANLSWVMVGLAALPSSAAWMAIGDKHGYGKALIWAHLIQTVGVALPALSGHPAALLLGALLYGATFLGIVGMALALGRQIMPAAPTRAMGWLTATFGVGQILGPILGAGLKERFGWNSAMLGAAAIVLLGVPLLLAGGRKLQRLALAR